MQRSIFATLLGCTACLFAAGCGADYGRITLDELSSPPTQVTIRDAYIEIPAGVAIVVKAGIESDTNKDFESSDDLDLLSENRGIFVTYKRGSREFVFVGQNRGQTCVEVLINGSREDCIEVLVTDPAL